MFQRSAIIRKWIGAERNHVTADGMLSVRSDKEFGYLLAFWRAGNGRDLGDTGYFRPFDLRDLKTEVWLKSEHAIVKCFYRCFVRQLRFGVRWGLRLRRRCWSGRFSRALRRYAFGRCLCWLLCEACCREQYRAHSCRCDSLQHESLSVLMIHQTSCRAAIGNRRPTPNAFSVILIPGAAC